MSADRRLGEWWVPGQYVQSLVTLTPIPDLISLFRDPIFVALHRHRTLYPLEQIDQSLAIEGPKLVYGHLFFGHPPFVFGPNGERTHMKPDPLPGRRRREGGERCRFTGRFVGRPPGRSTRTS